MRVVITGAAGRIGQCLMAGLVGAGHEVRGVDVVAAGDDVIVADLASDADVLASLMDGPTPSSTSRPFPPRPTSRRPSTATSA